MSAIYKTSLIAISHLSKILTGFILIKIIAINIGPVGLGDLGNLLSIMAILSILAGGGVVNASIKYVAEYQNKPRLIIRFYSSALVYSTVICFTCLFLGLFFHSAISEFFFNKENAFYYVLLLLVSQFSIAFSNLVIGGINGYGQTQLFSKVQIIANLIALVTFIILFNEFDKYVASVISVVVMYISYIIPTLYVFFKFKLRNHISLNNVDYVFIKKIYPYSIMAIIGCLSFPVTEFLIRTIIEKNVGISSAGLWLAVMKLSGSYVGFISILLVYVLVPKLSLEKNWNKIYHIIVNHTLYIVILFIPISILFYFLREEIIILLLSPKFIEVKDYIIYQLVGDFFKVVAYCFSVLTIAKSTTKLYVTGELLQAGLFISSSLILMEYKKSLESVFVGYMISYVIYSFIVIFAFYKYLKSRRRNA